MGRKRKGDIGNITDPDGNFLESEEVLVPETQIDFPLASEETEKVRQDIKNLTASISNCYYELSCLVYKVNKERLYKTWGYSEFADWASEELGFQKRKAYYLVQFQDYCSKDLKQLLPDQQEYTEVLGQLKTVGWTKALEIVKTKILNKENCVKLLTEAKEDKIDDFIDKIKVIKTNEKLEKDDGITENTMKKVKMTFKLTTAQEELVLNALEKAKMAINREDVSQEFALEYMAGDFLAGAVSSLESALSQTERIHSVSVVAFNDVDKKVVYGADTLVAISRAVGG